MSYHGSYHHYTEALPCFLSPNSLLGPCYRSLPKGRENTRAVAKLVDSLSQSDHVSFVSPTKYIITKSLLFKGGVIILPTPKKCTITFGKSLKITHTYICSFLINPNIWVPFNDALVCSRSVWHGSFTSHRSNQKRTGSQEGQVTPNSTIRHTLLINEIYQGCNPLFLTFYWLPATSKNRGYNPNSCGWSPFKIHH